MTLDQHNLSDKTTSTFPSAIKNLHNFMTLNYGTQPVNFDTSGSQQCCGTCKKLLRKKIMQNYFNCLHQINLMLFRILSDTKKGDDRLEVEDSLWKLTYISVKPKLVQVTQRKLTRKVLHTYIHLSHLIFQFLGFTSLLLYHLRGKKEKIRKPIIGKVMRLVKFYITPL